jgi:cytochrome b pre-mRNA-processing protein 3
MVFKTLQKYFARKQSPAESLYGEIVAAARQADFYNTLGVPDTVDGRFDMIVLHMYLVLNRLKGDSLAAIRQDLTDVFFKDMDRSLREMGAGDLSVGKKVRKMAEAFFGRIKAYEEASDENKMTSAIARNVFAELPAETAGRIAQRVLKLQTELTQRSDDSVLRHPFANGDT